MRTMCLGCGTPVEDDGGRPKLECPKCGRAIRSRQYEMIARDDVGRFIRYGEDPDIRPQAPDTEPKPYDPYWTDDSSSAPEDHWSGQPYPMRKVIGHGRYRSGGRRPSFLERFLSDIFRFGLAFWIIAFVLYFFIGHIMALGGAMATVPVQLMDESYVFAVFTPVAFGLFSISGYALAGYFLLICLAIVMSTMLTLREWRPFMAELRGISHMRKVTPGSTPMVLLYFFLIDISLVIVYNVIVLLSGSAPAGPGDWDFENWELLFLLANASVYEELITRVLFIGLPLAVIGIFSRRYRGWRTLFGGTALFDRPTMFLIIMSSLVFGMAHVIYGWDTFKFPSAFFSGLLFGYLYIEKGLHASIMLHFMIDYFGAVQYLGLTAGLFTGMALIEGVLVISAIPIGLYLTFTYGLDVVRDVRKRYARDSRRSAHG